MRDRPIKQKSLQRHVIDNYFFHYIVKLIFFYNIVNDV